MILLLGATGYIGQAFARELRRRGNCFIPLSRKAFDYTRFDLLFDYLRKVRPDFVINAAGYSGRPNMDACELARTETFHANTLLPQTIARACLMTNTPWGHVSSGCIYSGAKVFQRGELRIERDLNRTSIRRLFEVHPERFFGFSELDEPNFSFRFPPCNFLSGTKALAEEALREHNQTYIWRPMLAFNEYDHPSNLLTKLQTYPRVYDHVTSLSHVGDFVSACLDLAERSAPFGIYNIANPGAITTRRLISLIERTLKPDRSFDFWTDDDQFYSEGAKAIRPSCILDTSKLLRSGVRMRPVEAAVQDALERWRPAELNRPRPQLSFEDLSACPA